MTSIASVKLETLRCIKESDRGGSSHSEPYIWPFMAAVTNNSFTTTPTAAILSDSRRVIKSEMRAGQSALIDGPSNVLATRFEDDQTDRRLIVIVGLWEEDEMPLGAIQAGYQAFLDELKKRIGLNLLTLKDAVDNNDAALLQQTIDGIKKQVTDKVRAAIEDHLSFGDKVKIKLGILNTDDFMATGFALFSDPMPPTFTLDFQGTAGDKKAVLVPGPFGQSMFRFEDVPIHYQIDGTVTSTPVVIDPCQMQIDAVQDAKDARHGLDIMRQSLQQQLQHATPQQKPGIIAAIRQISEQQIPEADRRIKLAEQALRFCQVIGNNHIDVGDLPVLEPAHG